MVFRHSGEPRIGSGGGAGIESFQRLINILDSGFHRSDDFLRDHKLYCIVLLCPNLPNVPSLPQKGEGNRERGSDHK
jgi:hypothetical protein